MRSNLRAIHNQKDTAVLDASQFARIRKHSKPKDKDREAELIRTRAIEAHKHTLEVTSTWKNSIANQRKARIERLEKLAEEREEERRRLDQQEKEIRSQKKKEQLQRAEMIRFQEKPEIRAVNSQLKTIETNKIRRRQMLMKERKKQIEQEREDAWVEQERARIKAEEEKERKLQEERRLKAIEVANGFKQQKLEAEERKMQLRQEEVEEEQLLAEEAKRLLIAEAEQERKRKELELKNLKEAKECNATLIQWRAKMKELEKAENEKIQRQKEELDEARERREAAEKQRRAEKQAYQDTIIQAQQKLLAEIKAKQQQFDDTQYELQYQKDVKAIEELRAKEERAREERRRDYMEAQAKVEAKRNQRKERAAFPPDEATQKEAEAQWEREVQRRQGLKELAEFQKEQAREKKEREMAERERQKLEFRRQIELDQEKLAEAQEYAREMLITVRRQRSARRW